MSNAQRFCDALAARRWYQANFPHQPLPVELEDRSIRGRYLEFALSASEDGDRITFLDESVAVRDGIWTVAS